MSGWRPASNGTGARHWFLTRDESVPFGERYYTNKRGDLIWFKSFETAQRRASTLNAA